MFLQAFIAFIFGSIVMSVLKWQAGKLADWHIRKQLAKRPPAVPPSLMAMMEPIKWCTCSCGERHPRFCDHE